MAVTIPAGQGSHSHFADPSHVGAFVTTNSTNGSLATFGGTTFNIQQTTVTQLATLPAMSGTAATGGSNTPLAATSAPFANMPPFVLGTFYIKL